ncbi:MAG: thioredoxin family protein [Bacteroidota bacterium]
MNRPLQFLLLLGAIAIYLGCTSPQAAKSEAPLRQLAFEQLDTLMREAPRPIAVFFHTDWCGYCANMKQTTFKNKAVVNALNEGYYFVSFDAESERPVQFNGQGFVFEAQGRKQGVHQLAKALGSIEGQLQYPTFVLLNTQYEIIFQMGSFLSAEQLLAVLNQ